MCIRDRRQQVLQSYVPDSVCIQFDEIKSMKVADLRDVLTKRQVIYAVSYTHLIQ